MGSVYLWFEDPQIIGSVIVRPIICRLNRNGAEETEMISFQILGAATRSEVKKIWDLSACTGKGILKRGGHWYEVHTD